jgi:glutamine amidotransferase
LISQSRGLGDVYKRQQPFSAMLQKDNFYAAQFHAEISGMAGQKIIQNFLAL